MGVLGWRCRIRSGGPSPPRAWVRRARLPGRLGLLGGLGRLHGSGPVRSGSKTQIHHLPWINLGGFLTISDLRVSHVKLVGNSLL